MRMSHRNNLPIHIRFPLALAALLLLLSSALPVLAERAVAHTNEDTSISLSSDSIALLHCFTLSYCSPPSFEEPHACNEPPLLEENPTPKNGMVFFNWAKHVFTHGTRTRNTYRRYIVLASSLTSPPVVLPELATTPLLVLEIHAVAQASLCYHHSGRSPPTLL